MTAFTIHRSHLLPMLEAAKSVVPTRNTIPILANAFFEAAGERLTVRGCDLDTDMAAAGPLVSCKADGAFTLPCAIVFDIVRRLPESAEIGFEKVDENRVKIFSGRSRYHVGLLPASDFPDITAGDYPSSASLDGRELSAALETVAHAMSNEQARYYLNGVYLHESDETWLMPEAKSRLILVSTDGNRLSAIALKVPKKAKIGAAGIIIPRAVVPVIAKMAGGAGTIALSWSDMKIAATAARGDLTLSLVSKLIDGTFPDYSRVVPKANPNGFCVDRAEMLAATERVAAVSRDRGRGMRFAFADGTLTITITDPDAGDGCEEIGCTALAGAEAVEIGFNWSFVRDTLSSLHGDRAIFHLEGKGAPALVTAEGRDDLAAVIMPMRM